MTTPERLRRRQRIEGAMLIMVGIAMFIQSWYFEHRDDTQDVADRRQQQCVVENFRKLTIALEARAKVAERETRLNQRNWGVWAEAAGMVRDDPTKPLKKADRDRLNRKLVAVLLAYDEEIKKIKKERSENPVPPYPVGSCKKLPDD